jgi:hypothetical protein
MQLDGDAAFAFEVEAIEDLRFHLALAERASRFQQAVSERGLAVINVRNDTEIANVVESHCRVFLAKRFQNSR